MGPQSPNRSNLYAKKVLLIDRFQATREARAAVLRSHAVEVHEAEEISAARFLWQPQVYDLVMFDIRRYSREEALEFYEQIRAADPRQRIIFFTGPPKYVSRTWPGEVADGDTSRGQWGKTVKRFLDAA
jgi:response regulator RpfG family c-di-GMP phosphodiesterase